MTNERAWSGVPEGPVRYGCCSVRFRRGLCQINMKTIPDSLLVSFSSLRPARIQATLTVQDPVRPYMKTWITTVPRLIRMFTHARPENIYITRRIS